MTKTKREKGTDFWWLTTEEVQKYQYVCVGHHQLYSDEPNSNNTPTSVPWFHSFDESGNLSKVMRRYPLKFVEQWRDKCANTNVFRSLSLFTTEQDREELLGPFVIDIDRENDETNRGYVQDLNKALEDTRKLVKEYLCKFNEDDFRIFFTGHKGFNIEVCPQALGIVSLDNRRRQFREKRAEINRTFGDNFADTIKECVRLHDSINSWIANDGNEVRRMKFQLSPYELNNLDVKEICRRSEKRALDCLSNR
jgi:hypothetical protein